MKKPKPPSKTHMVKCSVEFHEHMCLPEFLEWIEKEVPAKFRGTADVQVVQEWGYYEDCYSHLEISWKEEEDNPSFEKQLKEFDKKMAKWEKENGQ